MRGRKRVLLLLLVLAALAGALYVAAARVLGSGLVRAELERQLSARLGQPVTIGRASAAIVPRLAVDFHDVSIGAPARLTLGRIRIVTGLRPLFSGIVQDAEV